MSKIHKILPTSGFYIVWQTADNYLTIMGSTPAKKDRDIEVIKNGLNGNVVISGKGAIVRHTGNIIIDVRDIDKVIFSIMGTTSDGSTGQGIITFSGYEEQVNTLSTSGIFNDIEDRYIKPLKPKLLEALSN